MHGAHNGATCAEGAGATCAEGAGAAVAEPAHHHWPGLRQQVPPQEPQWNTGKGNNVHKNSSLNLLPT